MLRTSRLGCRGPSPLRFFFYWSSAHRDLHSFPTHALPISRAAAATARGPPGLVEGRRRVGCLQLHPRRAVRGHRRGGRSEEHTAELQSRRDLVCRLLLEKNNELDAEGFIKPFVVAI